MTGTVNIQDFIAHLRELDLIIVSRNEYLQDVEKNLETKQNKILKQDFITLSELTANKIIPRSKQTILNWIKSGFIKDYEYKYLNDKRKTVVLTRACVNRLIKELQNKQL